MGAIRIPPLTWKEGVIVTGPGLDVKLEIEGTMFG